MNATRLYIEFLDHEWKLDRSWHDKEDAEADAKAGMEPAEACGFVVAETNESITLTTTRTKNEYGPYITIDKRCIVRREELTAKTETPDVT